MRVSLALSCAAALAASAAPARAGVKDGVDAWSRGDYSRAVAEWQKPAAAGDADAEFNLAQAYKLGKGVSADLKRAEALYRQAADQGHLQAADMLGLVLFQSGRWAEALAWLTASAERGEPRAQYVLGVAHFNGDLVAKDVVRAYALMTRAAASGLEPAKTTLASMDATLPLADRQKGAALAGELEAKADALRATQLAAIGLGGQGKPVQVVGKVGPAKATGPRIAPTGLSSPPLPPVAPAPGKWRVQLGAFGVAGNAQGLWAKLKASSALAGRQANFVPTGKLTRLLAGPFATRAEAQAACRALSGQACIAVEK